MPEDLQNLEETLSDTYFCNFSLFQSMPDSWAIKQLFPVLPIHRLDEKPVNHAVIGDITCDSDGKMDQFIDRRDVKNTLELHRYDGEPYYLGVFLVGAYQEILGDLHNLFGDTHAVHVSLADNGDDGEHAASTTSSRATRSTRCCATSSSTRKSCSASCAATSRRRCTPARSTTARPGACCASTKTGCRDTPTWRTPRLNSDAPRAPRGG